MDIWLDQQNPLTLSPEAVKSHFEEMNKIKKRRKRLEIQPENSSINCVFSVAQKERASND